MKKYKPRKADSGIDTSRNFSPEITERTNQMLKELHLDTEFIQSISGKVNGTDYHFRTYGKDKVALYKNPKQTVKGKSLENALLMKSVNALARVEYRDPVLRAGWQSRYEDALLTSSTPYTRLWDFIRSSIRTSLLTSPCT